MEIQELLSFAGSILVPTFALLGWFYSRIDKRFDKTDVKFDKLDIDIKELRTSLNRMEGAFYSKDCCMLKDNNKLKHVE